MEPSNHTKLMNYLIGMCKKDKNWITVLADLGYDAQIIEQKITTSSGDSVTPDIIAVSNKLIHSLVFECKGGRTIDLDQLARYSTLTVENLLRWVTIFDREHLRFDVCVSDMKENHEYIQGTNLFPMLTFSSDELLRTRTFYITQLNDVFKEPIDLKGKMPPLSYYPFSQEDSDPYIAIHVIRTLLSIAIKNIKGGPDVFDKSIISCDEIIAHKFNHVWKALSESHKAKLRDKIREVIRGIMIREGVKEALSVIQQKQGYKIDTDLDKFKREAEEFVEQLEKQSRMTAFL